MWMRRRKCRAEHAAQPDRHRAVADYVAGMTDRFATREHRRLTGLDLFGDLAATTLPAGWRPPATEPWPACPDWPWPARPIWC